MGVEFWWGKGRVWGSGGNDLNGLLVFGAYVSLLLLVVIAWIMLRNAKLYFSSSKYFHSITCGVVGLAFLFLPIMAFLSERMISTRSDAILRTKSDLRGVRSAIVVYRHEYGQYPKSLNYMMRDGNDRHITFLHDLSDLQDAWGQCIRYTTNSSGFELRSAGKDKVFDTADDIAEKYEEKH